MSRKDFDKCNNVFVYGTLQSGHGNNVLLSSSSLVGVDNTKDVFVLGDAGFPYAFPDTVTPEKYSSLLRPVMGEVWKMESPYIFERLDRLEGVPHHYNRNIIKTRSGNEAWMYVQNKWSYTDHCYACKVKEGSWKW